MIKSHQTIINKKQKQYVCMKVSKTIITLYIITYGIYCRYIYVGARLASTCILIVAYVALGQGDTAALSSQWSACLHDMHVCMICMYVAIRTLWSSELLCTKNTGKSLIAKLFSCFAIIILLLFSCFVELFTAKIFTTYVYHTYSIHIIACWVIIITNQSYVHIVCTE